MGCRIPPLAAYRDGRRNDPLRSARRYPPLYTIDATNCEDSFRRTPAVNAGIQDADDNRKYRSRTRPVLDGSH
jgi:hypothetical protein